VVFRLSVPFAVRLSVIARRSDLDQQLAAGADPRTDPSLKLRAAQLCRMRVRRAIARRLGEMIDAARSGSDGPMSIGPVAGAQILAEADALRDLAVRLVGVRPVNPMGVALAKVLVSDAHSPLRVGGEPGMLRAAARLATAALDAPGQRGDGSEA
jgi:hypothetical protein